jgi:hypothetical protein
VLSILSYPSLPYEAKAVKTGTSLSNSLHATSTIHLHTISQSNNSTTSGCITYELSTRTITVSCTTPARLTDVNNALHDNSILAKQNPAELAARMRSGMAYSQLQAMTIIK